MNSFNKIGITGGIGSGKTTVCKIFETLSIPVYYSDIRAKELMEKDVRLVQLIIKNFGPATYDINKKLNRTYLAEKVFNDTDAIKTLNQLVHPAVGKDFEVWYNNITSKPPYILKEAALIFESGINKSLSKIIVVDAPEDISIDRVVQRDGISKEMVRARMSKQMETSKKVSLADYIINNDGKQALIPQILALHKKLISN